MSRSRTLTSCVFWGIYCWMAYAAIEILLAYVMTIAIGRYDVFPLWAWRAVGMVIAGYVFAGILSGSLAGILLPRGTDVRRHRNAATFSVVAAFMLNLTAALPLSRSEYVALAVAVLLAIWIALTIRSPGGNPRFLESPWIVSLLLLIFPWTSRELLSTTLWEGTDKSAIVKLGGALFGFASIAAIAWSWERFGERRIRPMRAALNATIVLFVAVSLLRLYAEHRPSLPAATGTAGQSRPNIILIVMDTVRADHLSLYGYGRETTPHLKALARDATVFRNAVATSDFTLPTHASMFTGMYPSWHGAVYAPPSHPFGRPLDESFPTLAEILTDKGYATASVVGNAWYFEAVFGLSRGILAAYAPRPTKISASDRPFYLREGMRKFLSLLNSTSDFDRLTSTADEVTAAGWHFVEQKGRQPLFLFLNYIDAHAPYLPKPPYDTRFSGKDSAFLYADYERLVGDVLKSRHAISPRNRDHLLSQYDGAIAFIDAQIGKLVARLKRSGLYENTLIIVTADHGEAFGERDLIGHSVASVYQDQIRVPLIIKYPGPPAPAVIDTPASHVDVMPTVLAALGYELPAHVQGINLNAEIPDSRVVLSEVFPSYHRSRPEFKRVKRALVSSRHKLIADEGGAKELYDHSRDPEEEHNLANVAAAEVKMLSARLRDLTAQAPTGKFSETAPVRNLEALRSLGYAQ